MATQSGASICALPASSFCERINSAGKIVMNSRSIQIKPGKLEERVLLRMNRKWLAHMRKWYQECTSDVMNILLEAHNALRDDPSACYGRGRALLQDPPSQASPSSSSVENNATPILNAHGRMDLLGIADQEMATAESMEPPSLELL
jgi:hypothetical protein